MILLFEFECTNGHAQAGTLFEFPGAELPPEKWLEEQSAMLLLLVAADPSYAVCFTCGDFRGRSWVVRAMPTKYATVDEGIVDLAKYGKLETY